MGHSGTRFFEDRVHIDIGFLGIRATLVPRFIGKMFLMKWATFVQGFICDRGHIGTRFYL